MRLFIAINFSEEIKNRILDIISRFKSYTLSGRFVKREHLHLTIEFLGEVEDEDVEKIITAMENIKAKPSSLNLYKIDKFERKHGDIYWIGLEKNNELLNLRNQIYDQLKEDFKLDGKEYTPHITIGRNVKINKYSNPNMYLEGREKISIPFYQIDLMKSEQVGEKLNYKTIYSKYL